MTSTGQLSSYWKRRIISLLKTGYQRQLGYQRQDGGFSAFGDSDEAGSTWLTAYVLRTFNEAREFIFVDKSLLFRALDWLMQRQNKDGSFAEIGRIIDQNTQGGNRGPALTAYVLTALLQNEDLVHKECKQKVCFRANKLKTAINQAATNLEINLKTTTDLFSLSVVTYALALSKSPRANEAFQHLLARSTNTGGLTYWRANATMQTHVDYRTWRPPRQQARPVDVLITSYALLAYGENGRFSETLPVIRWLTLQRNSRGGFGSSQDTAVALQALSAFASNNRVQSSNLRIQATGDGAATLDFNVNQANSLSLQSKQFQPSPRQVTITASGTGLALVEVDHSFNINAELATPSFDVSTVLLDDGLDTFNLMICTK